MAEEATKLKENEIQIKYQNSKAYDLHSFMVYMHFLIGFFKTNNRDMKITIE